MISKLLRGCAARGDRDVGRRTSAGVWRRRSEPEPVSFQRLNPLGDDVLDLIRRQVEGFVIGVERLQPDAFVAPFVFTGGRFPAGVPFDGEPLMHTDQLSPLITRN